MSGLALTIDRHMAGVASTEKRRSSANRAVLICLALLLAANLSVRSLNSRFHLVTYIMLVPAFAVFMLAVLAEDRARRQSMSDPVHRLAWTSVWVWLLTALCVSYGLLISVFAGDKVYDSVSYAFRLVPFALFPAFAFAIRSRHGWLKLLVGLTLLGTISSLIDLPAWLHRSSSVLLLNYAESSDLSYFYALVTALCLLLLVPLSRRLRVLLIATLPILLVRTFLSGIRAWFMILAVIIVYCLLVSWWLPKARERFALLTTSAAAIFLILAFTTSLGVTISNYLQVYSSRFGVAGTSIQYRLTEASTALGYGGIFGAGWGATGTFQNVVLLTSTDQYFVSKDYVHNFFAFMYWKLGVLGACLFLLLLGYVLFHAVESARNRDPLGFVVVGLWLAWFVNSMVDMNFSRPELNTWCAAWLGYFYWRSLWGRTPTEVIEPDMVQAPTSIPKRKNAYAAGPSGTGL